MSTTDAARLLGMADRILAGTVATPRSRSTRAAAVLARSALEELVTDRCARAGLDVGRASMTAQLACLRAVAPDVAGEAAAVWSGLSRACHQHAFEIAPNRDEVGHLASQVRRLVADRPA